MKEFKFKVLTSEQLFNFCEVLDAIGIEAFAEIFNREQIAEIRDGEEDVEKIGMALGAKILKVLVKELPKAKDQIHIFLASCVEDTTAGDIRELPLPQFLKLIKDFVTNDGMKDFFKEAISLFKGE